MPVQAALEAFDVVDKQFYHNDDAFFKLVRVRIFRSVLIQIARISALVNSESDISLIASETEAMSVKFETSLVSLFCDCTLSNLLCMNCDVEILGT